MHVSMCMCVHWMYEVTHTHTHTYTQKYTVLVSYTFTAKSYSTKHEWNKHLLFACIACVASQRMQSFPTFTEKITINSHIPTAANIQAHININMYDRSRSLY